MKTDGRGELSRGASGSVKIQGVAPLLGSSACEGEFLFVLINKRGEALAYQLD